MSYRDLMQAAHRAMQQGKDDAARELIAGAREVERQRVSGGGIPRADDIALFEGSEKQDRFGDTVSAAVEGPLAATKQFAAQSQDRSRTRLQRAGDYAMTGLNALGTAYAGAAGLAGEVLGGTPTQERQLARDLMMAGAVAIPQLAGASTAGVASRAASRGVPRPKNAIEASKRAADSIGATPSLGAGGKIRGMTAAGLEKTPIAGEFIARDALRYVDEIELAAARAKSKVGDASVPSEAGDTLMTGLNRFVERQKGKAEEKFANVAQYLPPGTRVPLNNTVEEIAGVKRHFEKLPELQKKLGLNEWDAVIAEAVENDIGWQAVRQLRSDVGEAIGSNRGALANESVGRLKQLYAALTKDMEATAVNSGQEALTAWKDANTFYRNFAQRVERSLDKTIKASSPERAFEAFSNMTRRDSSSADVNRMRQIKASLKPQEWKDVSSSIVDRLGKPTAGQQDAFGEGFSPQRFLTQWNGMSDEAKRLLLPESIRIELQKVAQASELVRRGNLERNHPNTGTVTGLAATAAGLGYAPTTTIAILSGATISAKAMTSRPFLRALNRAGRGDIKAMRAMSQGSGPFADDARSVMQILAAETAAAGGANQGNRPPARAMEN